MDIQNIIGYSATVVSTISFLPQVIKTWKLKSTKDFSLVMLLLGVLGSSLWFFYGVLLKAFPIMIANATVMSCFLIVLFFKLKYK